MISIEEIEFFLIILVRISGFIFTAPFFNLKNVPVRIKVGTAGALSLILYNTLPYEPVLYDGVTGLTILLVSETLVGLILGFMANICYQILQFAGQLLDMEIGFSMVNEIDPVTSAQVTVSGNFYSYAVMLMMMVTYMHHFLIDALIDSFVVAPVGAATINPSIYSVATKFLGDYFVLAFRIVLPIFGSMLLVNTILAILAKVAPQMSMFVIGIQLKLIVGLVVMLVVIELIPGVSELIFDKMLEVMRDAASYIGSSA
ncbi:MAG: flagellar biosynthetic protein FliR [Lachnospiraceae bacterium]|nr:flagellar biosynthetic protein FliR [Lachnospiraceae bacterium]